MKFKKFINIFLVLLILAVGAEASQTAFHFGTPSGPSEIAWGGQGTFTISIYCDNGWYDCQCTCSATSGTCSIGRVPASSSSSFSLRGQLKIN